jgi:phospholipase C
VDVAAGGTALCHWSLADSGQWYDFAVTCSSDPAFYRRFAGRVETGRHTVSDPAMGEV